MKSGFQPSALKQSASSNTTSPVAPAGSQSGGRTGWKWAGRRQGKDLNLLQDNIHCVHSLLHTYIICTYCYAGCCCDAGCCCAGCCYTGCCYSECCWHSTYWKANKIVRVLWRVTVLDRNREGLSFYMPNRWPVLVHENITNYLELWSWIMLIHRWG